MTLLNILRLTRANCYVSEALQFELYGALIIMTNGALDFFTDLTKRTGHSESMDEQEKTEL